MAKLRTAYMRDPLRNEYVGIVFEQGFLHRRILTAGVMDTESGIKLWLARVLRTRAWETASEPADKYG